MSEGVEHSPAWSWRWKKQRLGLVGEVFSHSGRKDLMGRPVDLGYVPGEDEELTDVTSLLGRVMAASANDFEKIGD
jgi:hypothetical protein